MEEHNTSLLSPLSLPPPPSLLSIPTTITQDFSFFNDTFFEKSLSGLVNVGDFGPSLYEWLDIAEEDAAPTETPIKHPIPSLSPYVVILEFTEVVAESQNPILSIIPSNPEVVVSNNNITNNRVGGAKRLEKSIVGGNGNLRGDEPDDEEDNIITRLKLRASTMASVADTMSMNNKRNKNNLSKITYLTKSESENLEDGYKWRKYGKKSLKKSPFPRSYYRCTAIGCNAKKRVERYVDDPTHVLTTYVGLHAHDLPPILPPPSRSFNLYNNSTVSPDKGSDVQKPVLSDASAGARERKHGNNTITNVNVKTDSDSCVNDIGTIEDTGTGLLEDIVNLSSIAPHHQHHQPTSL
ncbi:probable WRKY transcription factor 68 [Arachis ipaensis]|uniref:probable WRKY transcription factor 68 n=1 Tax=Arachis ipaensis TaxID=130454 RepID=UPI0007AF9E85|nr:probable WRKY transcription factor 68 [Arachis ipaensis]XP_025635754.2 WRKY transcription factor 68-like [Arachis hypogaea]QHO23383.1 putative WRKY transcription factor [Arachis hypogaea]